MFTPVTIMEMLANLHRRGYQRLRLSAGLSPSGMSWRYSVAPVDDLEPNGYLLRRGRYPGDAAGSSRGDDAPFMWEGGEALDAEELGQRFLERFPTVAEAGRGADAEYATWFAEALELCRPDGALIMYGEDVDAEAERGFRTSTGGRVGLPPTL